MHVARKFRVWTRSRWETQEWGAQASSPVVAGVPPGTPDVDDAWNSPVTPTWGIIEKREAMVIRWLRRDAKADRRDAYAPQFFPPDHLFEPGAPWIPIAVGLPPRSESVKLLARLKLDVH